MSEFIKGKKFLSAKEAGIDFGCTPDYISKLAREGKLEAARIGRAWYVAEDSIARFFKDTQDLEAMRLKILQEERLKEYEIARALPVSQNVLPYAATLGRIFGAALGLATFSFAFMIGYGAVTHNPLANLPQMSMARVPPTLIVQDQVSWETTLFAHQVVRNVDALRAESVLLTHEVLTQRYVPTPVVKIMPRSTNLSVSEILATIVAAPHALHIFGAEATDLLASLIESRELIENELGLRVDNATRTFISEYFSLGPSILALAAALLAQQQIYVMTTGDALVETAHDLFQGAVGLRANLTLVHHVGKLIPVLPLVASVDASSWLQSLGQTILTVFAFPEPTYTPPSLTIQRVKYTGPAAPGPVTVRNVTTNISYIGVSPQEFTSKITNLQGQLNDLATRTALDFDGVLQSVRGLSRGAGGGGSSVTNVTNNTYATGVTSLIAGSGVSISGSTGDITISATGSGSSIGEAFSLMNGALAPTTTVGVIVSASSTFTNTLTLSSLSLGGLAVNAVGKIYAAATSTLATISGALDLATQVGSSILAVANGGTGWGELQSNTLVLGNGTNKIATTSQGTNGQILSLVSGVPSWVATTTFSSGLSYLNGNVTLAYDPFTHGTQFGQTYSGTSTALRLTGSPYALFASSTSEFDNSTTTLATIGTLWFPSLTNSGLGVDTSGKVYAAATTTFSSGLTYSNGNVINAGVTSNVAGTGIAVSGATGAVTISQNDVYRIATTSDVATQGLAYFTKTAGLTTLGSAATGTISSANSALTVTSNRYVIGGDVTLTVATTSTNLFTGTPGQVLAYTNLGWTGVATTTFSTGLTYAAGAVTCDTASASVFGCLSSANWTTFNNKLSAYDAWTHGGGTTQSATTSALGIGTTTPWAQFSVSTSTASSPLTPLFAVASSTHALILGVFGSGAVGIGTTSPWSTYRLGVEGSVAIAGILNTSVLNATSSATINSLTLTNALAITSGGTGLNAITTGDLLYGSNTNTLSALTGGAANNGKILSIAAGIPSWVATTTFSSGLTYLNGNVTVNDRYQIATTSDIATQGVAYFTKTAGVTTLGSAATSSVTCSGSVSCGTTSYVLGGALAITGSELTAYDAWTHAGGTTQSATTSAIGIGTTTPFSQLAVSTSTQSSPFTKLFTVASTTGAELFSVLGNGNVGVGTSSPFANLSINHGAGQIPFAVGSTSATSFIIDANGNVGIGSTSPSQLLVVEGASGITGATPITTTIKSTNNSGLWTLDAAYAGINFDSSDGSNPGAGTRASIQARFENALGNNTSLVFSVSNNTSVQNSPVEALRITSSGKVGIGTSTPQWLLNPTSGTASQLALSAGVGIGQWAFRNAGGNLYFATTTVAGTATTSTSALTIIGDSGNIGIGTTTPADTLSIAGNSSNIIIGWDNTLTSGLETFAFRENSATKAFFGYRGTAASVLPNTFKISTQTGTNGDIILATNGATSHLFIAGGQNGLTAGYVGIGSTSPFALLSVENTGSGASFVVNDVANDSTPFFIDASGNVAVGSTTPWGQLSVEASATVAFVVSKTGSSTPNLIVSGTNGNVGIGTTTASSTLLNVGNSSISATKPVAAFGNATGVCYISPGATALGCASDIRLKKDIVGINAGLSAVMALNPVTYHWNAENTSDGTHPGFIAQEVQQVLPALVTPDDTGLLILNTTGMTPYLVKAIQELNLKLDALATTSPMTNDFATAFFQNLFARLTTWLADAGNGLGTVFANTFTAHEHICVDDQCLTRDDIRALLAVAHAQSENPSSQPPESSSESDTTAPVVTINGNNPATIVVGDSYVDLGASVTDNVDQNLGIHTFIGDTEVLTVSLDTSTSTTYSITYRATDQAGNTGEATRVVVVAP